MTLNSYSKILALDYGQKYIGLAVGDTRFSIAFPKGKIRNTSEKEVIDNIQQIIQKENITMLLIGMPFNLNGTCSEQENKTREFVQNLQAQINIPVETFDERFSTKIPKNMMKSFGMNEKEHRKIKDELSAQHILESYFQYLKNRNK